MMGKEFDETSLSYAVFILRGTQAVGTIGKDLVALGDVRPVGLLGPVSDVGGVVGQCQL